MTQPRVSVLSHTTCELGEGPTYEAATDTLWWFDILGRKLLEYRFATGTETVHALPEMASALGVVDSGRHLIFTESGLYLRDTASGRLDRVAEIEADNPVTRSNDARVHPSGSFWLGTMGRKVEPKAGSVYWYRAGEVRKLFDGITIINSICFSPSGEIAYFADSRENRLWRVGCDPETGLPAGEPEIFLDHQGQPGSIDGSICDADGNIWNARWGTGRLDAYDPQGARFASIDVPASQCACPAFVGPKADRLVATSSVIPADKHADDPEGGKTFIVDFPVRGVLEPKVVL